MTMSLDLELAGDPRSSPSASTRWLAARRLTPPARTPWRIAIVLDAAHPRAASASTEADTRLYLEIDSAGWGVLFRRGGQSSWIRVGSTSRVHEHDDFGLLPYVTDLRDLAPIVRFIERRFGLQFRRQHAVIHTDLADAQQKILLWVLATL